jgi:hypothetical protein
MQETSAHLLAEVRGGQGEMKEVRDANLKRITAQIDANMKNNQDTLVRMEANQEKMMAVLNACREKTVTCQETTEARLECKETTSKDKESAVEGSLRKRPQ